MWQNNSLQLNFIKAEAVSILNIAVSDLLKYLSIFYCQVGGWVSGYRVT